MDDRRILLAEKNSAHCAALQNHLAQLHYSVELCTDGIAALQRLKEEDAPRMALLSSSLTPITGLEIGQEIRRRSRRRHLWLMLMSEHPTTDEIIMATNAGIDEFLAKPVELQELRMRIRTGERVQELYEELSDSAIAMEFHSTHDPLTGAWRREAILDLIFKETDRVQRMHAPLSLLLIDIDGFTALNLQYGPNYGDKLLKAIATRLRHQLRSYDLLGRYARDEFMIAFPGCASTDAESKAQRISTNISRRPFTVEGREFCLSVSIGVASSLGRSPLIVLREAERALTTAKQQGPGSTFFFGDIHAQQPVPAEIHRYRAEGQ